MEIDGDRGDKLTDRGDKLTGPVIKAYVEDC
jgi:hypothetical protein